MPEIYTGHGFRPFTAAMEDNREIHMNQSDVPTEGNDKGRSLTIPVVQEEISIDKKVIETGKVIIKKSVTEEETTVNIPLIQEGYDVERKAVNKIVESPPSVRYEDDRIIIPVMREILVVEKRFEIIEEVHVIRHRTEVPQQQQVKLRKENITVEHKKVQDDPGSIKQE
ncbi:MAG: YsnF/AvaK domain-containing protein [Cytophagaceae bacterium]